MSYIRKHQNIFDSDVSDLFSSDHFKMQINEDFDIKISKVSSEDVCLEARINSFEIQRRKEQDAAETSRKKRVRNHKKHLFNEVDQQIKDLEDCSNT